MSDLDSPPSGSVTESHGATAQASAGTMLRVAREAQGLHIAMLAVSLKVSVKKLEAMEANRFDLLPDMVFVRALASSICRTLKLDEQPVMAALPPSVAPKISGVADGLRPRFQDASHATHGGFGKSFSGPWGIALALVFAAIVAIVFWPDKATIVNWMTTSQAANALPAVLVENNSSPLEPVQATQAATTPLVVASPASSPSSAFNTNSPIAVTGPLVETGNPGGTVAPATTGPLKLIAKGDAWIEVLDADGTILLRRMLIQGESVVLAGKLPLSVVLGRADLVTVWVRDQVFETSTYANGHVARFEVM